MLEYTFKPRKILIDETSVITLKNLTAESVEMPSPPSVDNGFITVTVPAEGSYTVCVQTKNTNYTYRIDVNDTSNDTTPETGLPSRLSVEALSTTYGRILADPNKKYRVVACVIRPNSGVWGVLDDGNHIPVGVASLTQDSLKVRITYDFEGAAVITMIAQTDEAFAQAGFTVGTSVTADYTDIFLGQNRTEWGDYVYYDGANWISNGGVFTGLTFSAGVLTLTHPPVSPIGSSVPTIVHVTGREGCRAYASSGSTSSTTKIEFRDSAHALIASPTGAMKAYVTRNAAGSTRAVNPSESGLDDYGASNIWVLGLIEVG